MDYDANGNRTQLTENGAVYAYEVAANGNRLLSAKGPTAKIYSYDAAGNVIGDGIHSYGYDDRGRLVDVNAGAVTYVAQWTGPAGEEGRRHGDAVCV